LGGHFGEEIHIIVGLLGVGGVGEEDDVALADIGFFEFVPGGFEAVVNEDAAAGGLLAADDVFELASVGADGDEGGDGVGFAVDDGDGDEVGVAEELDGTAGALIG
jgi:hypothetical protein